MTNDKNSTHDSTDIQHILSTISTLLSEARHNTNLVWQGVHRSMVLFGAAIAICSFLIGFKSNIQYLNPIGCAIISCFSIIGNRFFIFSITRNIEHVIKYKKAVGELEKILKSIVTTKKWVNYLPNSVYEIALKGTVTAKHNKQVSRSIPWAFLFISYVGFIGCIVWLYIELTKTSSTSSFLMGVILGLVLLIFVDLIFRSILQKTVIRIYKGEIDQWNDEFQRLV